MGRGLPYCVGAALLALAGCQSAGHAPARLDSGAEPDRSPTIQVATVRSADAYAAVGRLVRRCWFNPEAPLLTGHEYRAEASPDGTARITLTETTPTGALLAFAITLDPRIGGGTDLHADNIRIPEPLAAKLKADVDRWSRGDLTCLFDN